MQLEKNVGPINAICKVQIRSTDGVADIPSLSDLYHTPSSIRYNVRSRRTANGNLHDRTLRLNYPGLSDGDFEKFDELIKGVYQVFVRLENTKVFEIASSRYPMNCSSSFDINEGHSLVFSSSGPLSVKYVGIDESGITGKGGGAAFIDGFDYDFDFNLT